MQAVFGLKKTHRNPTNVYAGKLKEMTQWLTFSCVKAGMVERAIESC